MQVFQKKPVRAVRSAAGRGSLDCLQEQWNPSILPRLRLLAIVAFAKGNDRKVFELASGVSAVSPSKKRYMIIYI